MGSVVLPIVLWITPALGEPGASPGDPHRPEHLTAELASYPVWPEPPNASSVSDSSAWRVDFLEERWDAGRRFWASVIRVYLHPTTGEVFEFAEGAPLRAGTASDSPASSAGTRR